jgi:hypothetical protein
MTQPPDDLVSRALVAWTGHGDAAWPHRDEQHVGAVFGTDVAADVLPLIRSLASEYQSDARHKARDLLQTGAPASVEFRIRNPEISNDAVEALTWCYTFDFK